VRGCKAGESNWQGEGYSGIDTRFGSWWKSNLEVYRRGNPNLMPEYVNSIEAGYNGKIKNQFQDSYFSIII
jgi:outer membrane receptor protein involved in Fe transport